MSKRLTAALASLLMLASVLAIVPAAPASAHDIYHYANQKQQKCAYDPFADNQCWTVTVRVKVPSHHSHAQVCPAGTTGTYPNCYPVPPTNTDPTPENDWTDPKDGGTDTDTGTGTGTKGTRSNRGTTTPTDPCGDYADDLIAALNKANDGTNTKPNLPTQPAECQGSTNQDILDKIKNFLALRLLLG